MKEKMLLQIAVGNNKKMYDDIIAEMPIEHFYTNDPELGEILNVQSDDLMTFFRFGNQVGIALSMQAYDKLFGK